MCAHPRQPHRHDLPGADDRAEPGAHHRPPGRRAAAAASRPGCGRSARSEALALLDRVGIPDAAPRLDAYPHQFSGGQRQRIGIAMALACGPDLLIADEPTTALDVTIQKQILDLIQELVAERGMALILISHDLGVIAQNVRQHAGDVRRQRGRERPHRRGVRQPRASLHAGPVRARGPALRRPARRAAGDHPRHACRNWSTCRPAAPSPAAARFTIDDCHATRAAARAKSTPGHQARCIRLDAVAARPSERRRPA